MVLIALPSHFLCAWYKQANSKFRAYAKLHTHNISAGKRFSLKTLGCFFLILMWHMLLHQDKKYSLLIKAVSSWAVENISQLKINMNSCLKSISPAVFTWHNWSVKHLPLNLPQKIGTAQRSLFQYLSCKYDKQTSEIRDLKATGQVLASAA